jgi:Short C-terminal domain
MMGKRHAEGQQEQAYEDQQPPAAPAPPPSGGVSDDSIQRLEQLGKLHEQGVLTDDEFAQQKEKVLAG